MSGERERPPKSAGEFVDKGMLKDIREHYSKAKPEGRSPSSDDPVVRVAGERTRSADTMSGDLISRAAVEKVVEDLTREPITWARHAFAELSKRLDRIEGVARQGEASNPRWGWAGRVDNKTEPLVVPVSPLDPEQEKEVKLNRWGDPRIEFDERGQPLPRKGATASKRVWVVTLWSGEDQEVPIGVWDNSADANAAASSPNHYVYETSYFGSNAEPPCGVERPNPDPDDPYVAIGVRASEYRAALRGQVDRPSPDSVSPPISVQGLEIRIREFEDTDGLVLVDDVLKVVQSEMGDIVELRRLNTELREELRETMWTIADLVIERDKAVSKAESRRDEASKTHELEVVVSSLKEERDQLRADWELAAAQADRAEAILNRLADWIEENHQGVQVYRENGLVVT